MKEIQLRLFFGNMDSMQKPGDGIMNSNFPSKKVLSEIFKAQEEHHKKASKLSIEKKIKLMVNMQRALNGFNKKGEKGWRVWEI
jgi:hypothetical protein